MFKHQGLAILARRPGVANEAGNNNNRYVLVGAQHLFTLLIGALVACRAINVSVMTMVPDFDIQTLGLNIGVNHPCSAVLTVLPVLLPVSRPSMQTLNLKTGQPFVVEVPLACSDM